MKQTLNKILVAGLISVIVLGAIPMYGAAAPPTWLPGDEDIEDYNLLWYHELDLENFLDPESENFTYYTQLWYQNNSEDLTTAFIGEAFVDFGDDYMDQKVNPLIKTFLTDFDGETVWDLLVWVLEDAALDGIVDISDDLSGWDHAIELNVSDTLFRYIIIGTLDTKFGMSFALEINQEYWFSLTEEDFGSIFGFIVESFMVIISTFTFFGSPLGAQDSIQTTPKPAGPVYTERENMIEFNSMVGIIVNPDRGIPGYSIVALALASLMTVVYIKKKRT
jgi:hypothetical protein